MAFDFRNLEVYKKAKSFHILSLQILEEIQLKPYVKDQLGRASMSIVLNIAEGSGKFSKPDRRNILLIAWVSKIGCVAVLNILHDEGFIETSDFNIHLQRADERSRILYTMINNLNPDSVS